ncbi:hypothetical protein CC80DRAFT_507727 [Byssothecium circinans]|uniref:Uncharacterized protein n=1 Tax=Byssothecium circinans TaxID=147558 RepID=A0A6A5TLF9_9PLEO|nr:hypothetical protein CC80DRAFT_507727 [Byssothecium circinans]
MGKGLMNMGPSREACDRCHEDLAAALNNTPAVSDFGSVDAFIEGCSMTTLRDMDFSAFEIEHVSNASTDIRLAMLVRSLASGLRAPKDIEEIYRASEFFVSALSEPNGQSDHSTLNEARDRESVGLFGHLAATNYFNLIHAFEILVNTLRQELADLEPSMQGQSSSSSLGLHSRPVSREDTVVRISHQ